MGEGGGRGGRRSIICYLDRAVDPMTKKKWTDRALLAAKMVVLPAGYFSCAACMHACGCACGVVEARCLHVMALMADEGTLNISDLGALPQQVESGRIAEQAGRRRRRTMTTNSSNKMMKED